MIKNVFFITLISFFSLVPTARACVDYYVQAPSFNYQPQLFSPTIGVTTINVTKFSCTNPVYLRVSTGRSASYQSRYMDNGRYRLRYNFHTQPSAGSAVWGDGSGGTYSQQISGATSINLYTIIEPQQDIAPGYYADSVSFQFSP